MKSEARFHYPMLGSERASWDCEETFGYETKLEAAQSLRV
jgi:hypothetical protein